MKKAISFIVLCFFCRAVFADDGYKLWLNYKPVLSKNTLQIYREALQTLSVKGNSATIDIIKKELQHSLSIIISKEIKALHNTDNKGGLIVCKNSLLGNEKEMFQKDLITISDEGYIISSKVLLQKKYIYITAKSDIGLLYGTFAFIKLLQTEEPITNLQIVSSPKLKLRLLNHWDNLNRSVERGYAGLSIWNWHTLPNYIDQRYIDYARANASIGINGTVLTNVNANALVLTQNYLEKVKALADVFRPYGIKVYLTARFSAPIEIGGLKTADPLNEDVKGWWKNKADEIYKLIPDFGGFLVKANSEGQPGPQAYDRTHADGANMLADAVAPHNGIIMWRAFVYSNERPEDRHKQAFNEFVPLDGKFKSNVMVQVKNGPIDFMPREPFHPLFGAMPKTPLMMEFQVTQEYLGQATNLVYLAPLFKETLFSDTYSNGKGSTVAKTIDGSMDGHKLSGMAGVANIGSDINWCGHPFAQANWYALGRLAWDYDLSSEKIADEWLKMTFTNNADFVKDVKQIMLSSREILVNYMNPLGLHHIMATGHHYGPGPWVDNLQRTDWNPVYYHKADSAGIGFDRTETGSNALGQYNINAAKIWVDKNNNDEKFLLWFQHVSWNYKMKSGKTLWDELCYKYNNGVDSVRWIKKQWSKQNNRIDATLYQQVYQLINIQEKEAVWWRNACLLYFQTFAKKHIPAECAQPDNNLDYYKNLKFPYAPGN